MRFLLLLVLLAFAAVCLAQDAGRPTGDDADGYDDFEDPSDDPQPTPSSDQPATKAKRQEAGHNRSLQGVTIYKNPFPHMKTSVIQNIHWLSKPYGTPYDAVFHEKSSGSKSPSIQFENRGGVSEAKKTGGGGGKGDGGGSGQGSGGQGSGGQGSGGQGSGGGGGKPITEPFSKKLKAAYKGEKGAGGVPDDVIATGPPAAAAAASKAAKTGKGGGGKDKGGG